MARKEFLFRVEQDANTTVLRVITDPYDFHVAGSTQTVEFYGYGAPLSQFEAVSCFRKALNDAMDKYYDGPSLVGTNMITYYSSSGDLALTLVPRDTMTWRMWADAVIDMISFLLSGFHREWQFLVLEEGYEGEVAYGALSWKAKP